MRRYMRFLIPGLVFVAMLTLLCVKMVYAQEPDVIEPPSIDQIVSGLMTAVGTWLAMYAVNLLRVKFKIIPGSIFVGIIVNVIGLGVSWLQDYVGIPGHSYVLSLFATFGAVWLSQVQAQLNPRTGPEQYKFGATPTK